MSHLPDRDGEEIVKVSPDELKAMVERSEALGKEISRLQVERRELDYSISVAEAEIEGMPQVDGWYLDVNGNIACREGGVWHDGWGNCGPDYGHFEPPMTRLIPEAVS